MIASFGGPGVMQPVMTVSRRDFAGYWEYLLENAIFTSPPYRFFGGAALMSTGGRLVGVGSLIVPDAAPEPTPAPGNMFVPVAQLKSVLADLIVSGRSANPLRPWLGVYAEESEEGRVVVLSLADGGPALKAGIEPGDVIVSAGDARVHGLADFYRKLWNGRGPGDRVTITVERDGEPRSIDVLGRQPLSVVAPQVPSIAQSKPARDLRARTTDSFGLRCRARYPVERLPVLARSLLDDPGRQWRCRRGLVPVEGFQVVAHELLVEARRAGAGCVPIGGPETRRVRCQHLVDEHQLAVGVEGELELGVGDDDAARRREVRGFEVHANARVPHPFGQLAGRRAPPPLSKSMFSSCAPASALVEGVKMTSGSLSACLRPDGSRIPHTAPVRW